MANYKELIPHIKTFEGNWAGNIDGAICTMRGITLATYRQYFGTHKTCQDLRNIKEDEWNYIFKKYWDRCRGDEIHSQSIANTIVDFHFNAGTNAIKTVQRTLGVTVDGILGPMTLSVINSYPDQKALFNRIQEDRKKYYRNIAKGAKAVFLRGWERRTDAIKWIG